MRRSHQEKNEIQQDEIKQLNEEFQGDSTHDEAENLYDQNTQLREELQRVI